MMPATLQPVREAFLVRHAVSAVLALFFSALAACLLGYLALSVPGPWFPSAAPKFWSATELSLSRGTGGVDNGELVVLAPDATGTVLVTVNTDFRSTDYRGIAWVAIDIPEPADVRLLWRSDYAADKLNSTPISVAAGRLRPLIVADDRDWIGRITGLALTIRGPLPRPVRIRGVTAKPMGAVEVLGDRVREWLAFEGWSGTSINSVTGGADVQDLPLPLLLSVSAAIAVLVAFALARGTARARLPLALALTFVAAWVVLDARWALDLARQVRETGRQYAGKDWRGRHLAAEDGPLFAFVEKVRTTLPSTPVRVVVAADAHYFRSRAAYHLYPHNVYFDPYANTLPASTQLRRGDYVLIYQRRGVHFDAGAQRLRWDGGAPVAAEMLLAEAGAALFRIL